MSIESRHAYRFEFLRSEEWKGIRLVALARSGAKCRLCGKIDWSNDAHHKNYKKKWKETKPGTLMVLCRSDHDLIHSLMKMFPKVTSPQIVKMVQKDRRDFGIVAAHTARNLGVSMPEHEFQERQRDFERLKVVSKFIGKLLTQHHLR